MKRRSGCCAVYIYCTAALTSLSDSVSYITFLFRNGVLLLFASNLAQLLPLASCFHFCHSFVVLNCSKIECLAILLHHSARPFYTYCNFQLKLRTITESLLSMNIAKHRFIGNLSFGIKNV